MADQIVAMLEGMHDGLKRFKSNAGLWLEVGEYHESAYLRGYRLALEHEDQARAFLARLARDRRRATREYPDGWPECPGCGEPILDGKLTCGLCGCRGQ